MEALRQQMRNLPILTNEQVAAICARRDAGDKKAIGELVQANYRYIYSVVTKVRAKLDDDDKFQHGIIGCITAAERFDAKQGFKFTTYAKAWIEHAVRRADANESGDIRLPDHAHSVRRMLPFCRMELSQKGIDATPENIAAWFTTRWKATSVSVGMVNSILTHVAPMLSLDAPVGSDEGSRTLAEVVAAPEPEESDGETLASAEFVRGLVGKLTPLEHLVLWRRFINGMTLSAAGDLLDRSRERIRQLETQALRNASRIAAGRRAPDAWPARSDPRWLRWADDVETAVKADSRMQAVEAAVTEAWGKNPSPIARLTQVLAYMQIMGRAYLNGSGEKQHVLLGRDPRVPLEQDIGHEIPVESPTEAPTVTEPPTRPTITIDLEDGEQETTVDPAHGFGYDEAVWMLFTDAVEKCGRSYDYLSRVAGARGWERRALGRKTLLKRSDVEAFAAETPERVRDKVTCGDFDTATWFTREEAADEVGTHRTYISHMAQVQGWRCQLHGHRKLYHREDVAAYKAKRVAAGETSKTSDDAGLSAWMFLNDAAVLTGRRADFLIAVARKRGWTRKKHGRNVMLPRAEVEAYARETSEMGAAALATGPAAGTYDPLVWMTRQEVSEALAASHATVSKIAYTKNWKRLRVGIFVLYARESVEAHRREVKPIPAAELDDPSLHLRVRAELRAEAKAARKRPESVPVPAPAPSKVEAIEVAPEPAPVAPPPAPPIEEAAPAPSPPPVERRVYLPTLPAPGPIESKMQARINAVLLLADSSIVDPNAALDMVRAIVRRAGD